ncbi:MAG: outer membrane beta-barrel protein [Pseudomonadota bacterium]
MTPSLFLKTITVFTLALLCQFISIHAEAAILTFHPQLSIEEEYTSNFFLTSEDEEYDFSTIVSPGFVTQLIGKMGNISLYYNPAYHIYSDHTDYNGWSHNAGVTGTHRPARNTTVHFANSFLYTSEPIVTGSNAFTDDENPTATQTTVSRPAPSFDSGSRPSFDSSSTSAFDSAGNRETQASSRDISLRGSRQTYYTNSANLGLTHQIGPNDTLNIDYTYRVLENDDPMIDDNQSHRPSILLSYWLVPNQWRIEAGGTYVRGLYDRLADDDVNRAPDYRPSDDFNNWQADLEFSKQFDRHLEGLIHYNHLFMVFDGDTDDEDREEDYQIYNPSIGIRYIPREDTNIRVSVGYYIQDWEISDDDSGFIANCDIDKTWMFRQASIRINGSSGYDISYLDATNLGFRLYYGAGINAEYRITRDVAGYLFSAYRWEDYPPDDTAAEEDREDHNLEYGVGFTYQATPWLSSRVQGSSRFLKSTDHENDFMDNRILLNLTLSPSQPYRY